MPVNSGNYNNNAILGAQIERLVQKALQKYVEGSNVIAEMGNNFDARLKAVEDALKSSNVGTFVADSVETQSLKVGGEDVAEALDSKIGNVKATAGPNIGNVGTPSVTVTNNPTTHESTLTFNYLKGAKGDKGDKGDKGNPGTNGTNGTNGVSCTHSWNGTTLTVTSASGTSSANLKGDKGDTGTWGGTVDQTYNAESQNPQSGAALARHMIRPIILSNGPTGLTHTETFSSSVPQYFNWTSSNYSIDPNTSYIADFTVQSAYKNTMVNIEIWAKKKTGKTWIGKLTVPLCRGIGYGQIILNRTDGIAFEFSADIEPNDFSVGDEITIIPSFLVG